MTKWLVVENRDAWWYFDVNEIADDFALYHLSEGSEKTYEELYIVLFNGPSEDIEDWFHDYMKPEEIFNQKKIDKEHMKYWNTDYDYWYEIIDD